MNWTDAFQYCVYAFLAYAAFFNILYFVIVVPRLRSSGHDVGFSAFVSLYQPRNVRLYIDTLSNSERGKWYNIALKHSFLVAGILWTVGLIMLFIGLWHEP